MFKETSRTYVNGVILANWIFKIICTWVIENENFKLWSRLLILEFILRKCNCRADSFSCERPYEKMIRKTFLSIYIWLADYIKIEHYFTFSPFSISKKINNNTPKASKPLPQLWVKYQDRLVYLALAENQSKRRTVLNSKPQRKSRKSILFFQRSPGNSQMINNEGKKENCLAPWLLTLWGH